MFLIQNTTLEASYCKFFGFFFPNLSRKRETENKAKLLLKETIDKAKVFLFA